MKPTQDRIWRIKRMDEKTKRILDIYSKMPLEEVLKLESTLPEEQKIMTKNIPVTELVFNEKL